MSHDYTKLLARLDESLPKADERESVWCSVQGHDLRAAVQAIAAQAAEISQLRAERDAAVVDAERWRRLWNTPGIGLGKAEADAAIDAARQPTAQEPT